jgi:hypothetical protein
MNTLFTFALVIGGAVLAFQFVLMLLGVADGDSDISGGHDGDFSGHANVSHDVSGHVDGDHAGGGHDHGHPGWLETADADAGHPGAHWFYEIISIRTIGAALTFFGLAGKTALAWGYTTTGSTVLASVVGLGAMYAVYWMFKQVYRFQHSGTENIRNAIGAPAVVYVPIPGKRAGAGKVTFKMQNRIVEYQAVTDDDSRLATGDEVIVVAIENSDTVRVARATSLVAEVATSNSSA